MSQLMRGLCVVIAAVNVGTFEAAPQVVREVVREWANAHAKRAPGEPMMLVGPAGDYPPTTIAELTKKADVVFHGRLYQLSTYIGRDGERVLTDWMIRDSSVLAARTDSALVRVRDTTKPLVVTMYGGELTVEGVQVIATPASRRNVVEGGEYLLFLMPSRGNADKYELYHAGVFAVEDTKIEPLLKDAKDLIKDAVDAPLSVVLAKIEEARIR